MNRIKTVNLVMIISLACAVLVGCGGKPVGTVTGTVTFQGQPIEQGLITFSPAGAEGSAAGGTISNGKYSVTGLALTRYHVMVEATKEPKFTSPGDPANNRTKTAEEIRAQYDPLPLDTTGKEQDIDVKAGTQSLDFKLTSKSKPAG